MGLLSFGPFDARFYSGDNWTHFEFGIVTNREGGLARRESAVKIGGKSEHAIEIFGVDNPADVFVDPATGQKVFGRISRTLGGTHVLSAEKVYSKGLFKRVQQEGLAQAKAASMAIASDANAETAPVT